MRNIDEAKIKYFEENSNNISDDIEELGYNRKNVDNIKRWLVCGFVILCALPVFFCLYLMVKLNKLSDRADNLEAELSVKTYLSQELLEAEATEITDVLSEQDAFLLDQGAEADLEKEPGESTQVLMGSDESGESDIDLNTGVMTHNSIDSDDAGVPAWVLAAREVAKTMND